MNFRPDKNLFIIVLIALNLITLSMLILEKNHIGALTENHTIKVFKISGQGENWKLDNYQVIVSADAIWRGSAELTYLGQPSTIVQSNYYYYIFTEEDDNAQLQTVLTGSSSSNGGTVNILENTKELGSIQGRATDYEKRLTEEDLKNSYFEIYWNDNEGKEQYERILLSVEG